LINCEYFYNLNKNGDMVGTCIMAGICTSPYPSPYPTEKVGYFPYPYPYPVNAGIPRQNGDGFGQYPQGRVYLPSLVLTRERARPRGIKGIISRIVPSLGLGCQIGTRFKKKIKMPRVKSLCVTRGIVSVTWHCNATCQCNYQMSLC